MDAITTMGLAFGVLCLLVVAGPAIAMLWLMDADIRQAEKNFERVHRRQDCRRPREGRW